MHNPQVTECTASAVKEKEKDTKEYHSLEELRRTAKKALTMLHQIQALEQDICLYLPPFCFSTALMKGAQRQQMVGNTKREGKGEPIAPISNFEL